ncbi:MAG: S41 family peptidase [Oscillospiraceae bacterium]|nr:S41 family peptidase [Oscillospiraceae bacterium]
MEHNKRYSTTSLIVCVAIGVLAGFVLSLFWFREVHGIGTPAWEEAKQLQEVREIISYSYVGKVDETALTELALAATVAALEDPWSFYLNQEQYEAHLNSIGNRQQGIGIYLERDEETNEVTVLEVMPGSPAEEAGLQPRDSIVMLEGQPTAPLETDEVRELIGANYGGTVTLEVRNPAGEMRTVVVEVRAFDVNPVAFKMLEDNVGYIRIANFDLRSGEETIEAIETLQEEGAAGLVFDVRNNPGGRVNELLMILDHLLPKGELFVFADYTGREKIHYSGPKYLDIPIVVLVNEHAFSAAEFFAAILQETDRATIVGMPTTGKGRSQILIPLTGGGAINLSTSRYLTPGRIDLHEVGGISPDVEVEQEDGEADVQLKRAIQELARR